MGKIGKRAVLSKSDASYFPSGDYYKINYNKWDVDAIGVDKNDASVYTVPMGSYLVIARFTAENHVLGKSFNLRAIVGGSEVYTHYTKANAAWDTASTSFTFTGTAFAIEIYQDTGNAVKNVAGRYTSFEIVRFA